MHEKVVVKRKGQNQAFDEKKVYASIYSSCRSAHLSEQQSELYAQTVLDALLNFLKDFRAISSDKIFEFVAKELSKHHKDAGYMYKTHRDIS